MHSFFFPMNEIQTLSWRRQDGRTEARLTVATYNLTIYASLQR